MQKPRQIGWTSYLTSLLTGCTFVIKSIRTKMTHEGNVVDRCTMTICRRYSLIWAALGSEADYTSDPMSPCDTPTGEGDI